MQNDISMYHMNTKYRKAEIFFKSNHYDKKIKNEFKYDIKIIEKLI